MHLSLGEANQTGERNGRLVDLAHEKPLQYHGVELASRPPHKEAIQLIKDQAKKKKKNLKQPLSSFRKKLTMYEP